VERQICRGLAFDKVQSSSPDPFLDRLYRDRERARAERDRYQAELSSERDRYQAELTGQRDRYHAELTGQRDRHQAELSEARRPRPADSELTHVEVPPTPFGRTEAPTEVDDRELVSRIVAAYRASTAIRPQPSQSVGEVWDVIAGKNGDVQEALARGQIEQLQRLLRDPGKTDLF
jgi:hypothetical protein